MTQSKNRSLNTIFCDDIRMEIGNKVSYMGVYRGTYEVNGPVPIVVPRIYAAIEVKTPIDNPFKRIHAKLYQDDRLVSEIKVDEDVIANFTPGSFDEDDTTIMIGLALPLQPFIIEKSCNLNVIVDTESEELKDNRLKVIVVA